MGKQLDYLRFGYKYLVSRYTHTPLWAYVFITYRCNLDCSYCYLHSPIIQVPDMSNDMFNEVIKRLSAVNCGLIAFMGGEPTIHNELPNMVEKAVKAGFITHLSTNGLTLTPDYVDTLGKSGIHVFNVSVDTMSSRSPSPKSLDKVQTILDTLVEKRSKYRYSIHVNQVLLPNNLDEAILMSEYMHKKNIKLSLTFTGVVRKGKTKKHFAGLFGFDTPDTLDRLDSTIEKLIELKDRGCTISTSEKYLRVAQEFAHTGHAPRYCTVGIESMQVGTDGQLSLCSTAPTPKHKMDMHISQLTPESWRKLRPDVENIVHKCNPTCLAACHFESGYFAKHPWELLPALQFPYFK